MTTFPHLTELTKFVSELDKFALAYKIVNPPRIYKSIAIPAVVMSSETKAEYYKRLDSKRFFSGWVNFEGNENNTDESFSGDYKEEVFGSARIMVLAPCLADKNKLRMVAHISGNLSEVFPYMNSVFNNAVYNPHANYLLYSDGYRRITLYPQKIALAKVDDIFDGWRLLESVYRSANDLWSQKENITPKYESRRKPTVLEIFKLLPQTNCGKCGHPSCLAFAVKLNGGEGEITMCRPVFEGDYLHLQQELLSVCAGL